MELLADHLATWGCHVAFPELSFLTVNQLRKFAKHSPVERFRHGSFQISQFVLYGTQRVGACLACFAGNPQSSWSTQLKRTWRLSAVHETR